MDRQTVSTETDKSMTLKSDSPLLVDGSQSSMPEGTHQIEGSTEDSPSIPEAIEEAIEEALEKLATRILKELQSSFLTKQDLQSGFLQLEQKMEGLCREFISREKDSRNTIAQEGRRSPMLDPSSTRMRNEFMQLANTDTAIDAMSLEPVGDTDTPIYVCAVYRPIEKGDVKTKWYMMGDSLENGLEFLFDSPPPHSVGESASVIVGSELYTVGGMDWNQFYQKWPDQQVPAFLNNKLYVKDLRHRDSDWKEGPSMSKKRMKPHVAVANGKLYVFGSDYLTSELEEKLIFHPWAKYLELSLPLDSKKWEYAGKNVVENQRIANGHAVSQDGKKILVYSSSTDDLLLYDSVTDSWTVHATQVGYFTATTFMDGIMYGAVLSGKQSCDYDIFAYDFTTPKSQKKVVISLDDIRGSVYPCGLIPVGQDKLYVLMTPYERDSCFSVVCFRYRIYKEINSVTGEVDITAVRTSKSKYWLPGVIDIVSFLAVPAAMNPDCCNSKSIMPEKKKRGKRRSRKGKGTKIGEGPQGKS